MATVLSFRDLDAWNAAMDLAVSTCVLCRRLPREEQYELARQMRRAAVSVPSNIAEGHSNGPGGRYRHHVRIALGSLGELATQLEIAVRLKYLNGEAVEAVELAVTSHSSAGAWASSITQAKTLSANVSLRGFCVFVRWCCFAFVI